MFVAQERPSELHMTLEIKRATTGAVEIVHLVGTVITEQEPDDGGNTQQCGPVGGD